MKKNAWFYILLSISVAACNGTGGDAKKEADSSNAAKADSTSNNTAPVMSVNQKTADYMVKIADAGMAEVQMGTLAKDKGQSKSVKDFGDMMIKDHGAANDDLKSIAAKKNVTLPTVPGDEHQKHIADLSQKTGNDFDKDYIDMMVKGHKDVEDMLEAASKDVTDTDVKAFIDKTLPAVRMHLDKAKSIQKMTKK